ncbi:hypothetical protein FZC78_19455 [Rossellomorea vietnamensis]|uniref:Uncharacterized protein n=1 Tax=Rossellomorea vietnamensis TaxID=218284 RepID=A0A5D4NKZ6_9BACI|nr:hypothetical protein FZC78_19455 [Rossellomorea vietnamensis]
MKCLKTGIKSWCGSWLNKDKSGSALSSPDRKMFPREKKAGFPFILLGLFDPEGLGAVAGRE